MLHSTVFKLMCRCIRLDRWLRKYSSLKYVGSDLQCSTPALLVLLLHCWFPGIYFACTAGDERVNHVIILNLIFLIWSLSQCEQDNFCNNWSSLFLYLFKNFFWQGSDNVLVYYYYIKTYVLLLKETVVIFLLLKHFLH